MNAKHSAILLSGLLLLMIGIAWAQNTDIEDPTCPPLSDESLQSMLIPSAWVRAYWDANRSRWKIVCDQMDSIANMPPANAYNSTTNAMTNALPSRGRRRSRGNSNYVNMNPYKAPPDANVYINGKAYPGGNIVPNVLPGNATNTISNTSAANAVNAQPMKRTRP
jgi:hypothetical protein